MISASTSHKTVSLILAGIGIYGLLDVLLISRIWSLFQLLFSSFVCITAVLYWLRKPFARWLAFIVGAWKVLAAITIFIVSLFAVSNPNQGTLFGTFDLRTGIMGLLGIVILILTSVVGHLDALSTSSH